LKGSSGKLIGKMSAFIGQYENCPDLDRLIAQSGKRVSLVSTEELPITADSDVQDMVLKYSFSSCEKAKQVFSGIRAE
jgi:hypothetical protein